MTTVVTSRLVGADDISFGTGSLVYTDVNGVIHTVPQVNASQIPFVAQNLVLEDILNGNVSLILDDLTVAGTLTLNSATPAGFLKNSAAGVITGANAIIAGDIAAAVLPTGIDAAKIANGTVSNAEFQFINSLTSNVQDQINAIIAGIAIAPSFAVLQNRQISTTGGGTATSGAWNIVPLNVEYEDPDGIVDSAALPAFTLAAGTYRIEASCPFFQCGVGQLRVYNVTDAAAQENVAAQDILGSEVYSFAGGAVAAVSADLVGTFTLAGAKQLRLEYRVTTTSATTGLGVPGSWGEEVFAQVKITKIA